MFVIIDDGKGAAFCREKAIPYINALLAPKILYYSGTISELEADTYLQKIIASVLTV